MSGCARGILSPEMRPQFPPPGRYTGPPPKNAMQPPHVTGSNTQLRPTASPSANAGQLQANYQNQSLQSTSVPEQFHDWAAPDGNRPRSRSHDRSRSNSGGRSRSGRNDEARSQSGNRNRDHSGGRNQPQAELQPQQSIQTQGKALTGQTQGRQGDYNQNNRRGQHQRGRGGHGGNPGRYQPPPQMQHYMYYQDPNFYSGPQYWCNDRQGFKDYNQGGSGRRQPRKEQDDLVFLSKTLSSILRHNAEKFHLKLMKGGFIYLEDIFQKVHKLKGFTLENIKWVVDNNDKKRFTLEQEDGGKWKIRANQGHTLEVDDLELTPITSADDYPRVIHGTYYESWKIIKETGLCRMNRNHIHFAAGEPGQDGVISGMRSSCEVMIYVDLEKALKDGLKFYLSSNNVILCPGNEEGYLFPCYFQGAKDRRGGYRLEFDHTINALKDKASPKADKGKGKKKDKRNKEEVDVTSKKEVRHKKKDEKEDKDVDYFEGVQSLMDPTPDEVKNSAPTTAEDVKAAESTSSDDVKTTETTSPDDVKNDETTASDKVETTANACTSSDEVKTPDPPSTEEFKPPLATVPSNKKGPKRDLSSEKEASASPAKKESPEWTDNPTNIADKESSQSAVEHILSVLSPTYIVVCCCGMNLGADNSDMSLLVIMAHPEIFIYDLTEDRKTLVTEGGLTDLFMSKEIHKVFHNIGRVSVSLIKEFDICMNGVPIWDVELMMKKSTLSKIDKEDLEEKFKMKMGQVMNAARNWAAESDKLAYKLENSKQEVVATLIERGKLMDELYKKCMSHLTDFAVLKELKTETYNEAIPGQGHFLEEKIKKMKEAAKEKEKQKKKAEAGSEQTNAKSQQPQSQKKHGKNKKKNKK